MHTTMQSTLLALEAADQRGAGQREARVERRLHAGIRRSGRVDGTAQEVPGGPDAEVGVVGDLEGAAAGAFRKAAPGVGLDAAMRRKRNCLWLERECSPKTSRYLSLSCAVVRLRRPSISSRIWVSVFMVLASVPMRALRLWEVNFRAAGMGEQQPDEGRAEDGGDLVDGVIESVVAIAHEGSPWPAQPEGELRG